MDPESSKTYDVKSTFRSRNPFRNERIERETRTRDYRYHPMTYSPRRASFPDDAWVTRTRGPPLPPKVLSGREVNLIDMEIDESYKYSVSNKGHFIGASISGDNLKRAERLSSPAILIMGSTGAGKSSFIARVTGAPVKIGDSIRPCTTNPEAFEYSWGYGNSVLLIDTPGFDDLERPDMEVLDSIVRYLNTKTIPQILGVIYMHRITDRKVTAMSRMNLQMLQALCGEHFYQNVILTTSMWRTVPKDLMPELEHREAELNGSRAFWVDMLEKGSRYERYLDTTASGKAILDLCLEPRYPPPALNIILEMRRGASLEETSAGQILTVELRKREERRRRELQEEAEDAENEIDALQAQKQAAEVQIRAMEARVRDEQASAYGMNRHLSGQVPSSSRTRERRVPEENLSRVQVADHRDGRQTSLVPRDHKVERKGKKESSLRSLLSR